MHKPVVFHEAQSKAILFGAGPMLVIAGPGSGKTLVITHRILNLIHEKKVNPQNILVITFTKAAALEMQNRFYALAGKDNVLNAYKTAVDKKYRFFSFGDCMFIK